MIPDDEERTARKDRKEPVFSAGLAGFAVPAGLAVLFLALHLPYLPASLEDLDSINFALGIRQFDVTHHQPHPPGYPVFMLVAKAIHAVVPAEVTALALMSVLAGALGVLALAAMFRRLDGPGTPARWSVAAVGVAMTTPLYWFTAVRPLSDSSGLAAALAVQAMTLGAGSARGLAIAGFCAGLAAGLRSQVVWLTVPLLALRALQGLGTRGCRLRSSAASASLAIAPSRSGGAEAGGLEGLRAEGRALIPNPQSLIPNPQSPIPVLAAFLAGILLWFVPLVIVSGGPSAYWHALFDQGAEDFGNIQMLWTMHRARDVEDALYYAFVAPWATWPVAAVGLTCASLGVLRLFRHHRPALIALAAAFGPYLVFDLLFQETFTSRYALPLVVPMAYLAVSGLRLLPWDTGLAFAVALAMFGAHAGDTSIAAYSRAKAPAFRLLDDMRGAAPSTTQPPVLAMDRREALDLRRPMKWMGDGMPAVARMLPAPPQHEWLEAVRYWEGGGRAPVWFIVDPMRTSIDLVQHGAPVRYRWPVPYPVPLSGVRPNEMDWYRVDRPEWYVGEGWSLTPESAGVATADGRDLSAGPIQGWLSLDTLGGVVMIGGRNFEPTKRPRLTVTVAGAVRDAVELPPGPFLRFISLPFIDTNRPIDYFAISIEASPASRIAVEQFDASSTRSLFGFGDGWHEQELNPRTGLRWRWLSERGELQIRTPAPRTRLMLHLEGESPRTYFSRGSRLIVRSGDRVVFDEVLSSDFSRDVPIADEEGPIVLETDQVFLPADRSSRSADRRHLGLRIFKCELRAAP